MTEYVESIYNTIKPHKKRVKEFDYGDLVPVKTREDIFYMSTNDDLVTIGIKQKNKIYSKIEINYYINFILTSKFADDTKFIESLKEKDIISTFAYFGVSFLDNNYYDYYFKANVKKSDLYVKKVLKYIKTNDFSEKDFKLFLRKVISDEALSIDIKYKKMIKFPFKTCYSDDFDDIDFLKTLTFESFIEFYKTLDFSNYTIAIVRNK